MKPVCFVSASLFSTHISIENKHVWLPKPCFSFSKSIRCYMNWSFLWEQVFNIWVNILLIMSVPVLGWHWIFTTNLLTIINVQVLGLCYITTNYLLMLNAPRFLNIGSQSDCLFISSTSLCYISLFSGCWNIAYGGDPLCWDCGAHAKIVVLKPRLRCSSHLNLGMSTHCC